MDVAFALKEEFREEFVLTGHAFTTGVIFLKYCEMKNKSPAGFTDSRRRETTVLFLKLANLTEIPHKDLMSMVEKALEPVVYEEIKEELGKLRTIGVEAIMDITQRMDKFVLGEDSEKPTSLNRSSLVGRFLRKLILSLNTTNFANLTKFSAYLKDHFVGESEDSSEAGPSNRPSTSSQDSSLDTDVSTEVQIVQRPAPSTSWGRLRARAYVRAQAAKLREDPGRATNPKQLQKDLDQILLEDPDMIDAQYLSFLNQMIFGEYNSAIENCHKFFLNKKEDAGLKCRYALLNLAMVHRKFGHIKQAELALKECIDLCQQSGDRTTLKHAFNWLYCTSYDTCNPTLDASLRCFDHSNSLYTARFFNLFEQIPLATLTPRECVESLNNKWLHKKSGPASMIAHNVGETLLWIGYGLHNVAKMHCEMVMHLCRSKITAMPKDWVIINESAVLALTSLARYASQDYEDELADKFVSIGHTMVPAYGELKDMVEVAAKCNDFEKALRKQRYDLCASALSTISLISPARGQVYAARLHHRKGNFTRALKVLESCEEDGPRQQASYPIRKLLKSRILFDSRADDVIGCILEGLADCEKFHLLLLGALFKIELARYQNRANFSEKSVGDILRSVTPIVLAHGSREDQLLLKKVVAEVTPDPKESIERMHSCYIEWKKYGDRFHQQEALEFLARKCNDIGDTVRRNRYSKLFRQLVSGKTPA